MTPTENRTIVITGANPGVGKSTARLLAAEGASVIMVCRNRERGVAAQREITEDGYDSMIPKTMWSVPYSRAVPGRTRGQTTFMVVPSIVASIACYRDNS